MKEIFENLETRLLEIGLVFEKAQNDEMINSMIEELKVNALSEAREHCNYLKIGDTPVSKEQFDNFTAGEKADAICILGSVGISEFLPNSIGGKINIKFSPYIQNVLSCTMFVILNKLENLDGAINVFSPEVKITVQAPLGGKKGLTKCYMLMQLLYPWCKGISETSTNEISMSAPAIPNTTADKPKDDNKDNVKKTTFNIKSLLFNWIKRFFRSRTLNRKRNKRNFSNINAIDYAVDIVYGIDCLNIDKKQLKKIEKDIFNFHKDYIKQFATGRNMKRARGRIILFTSYKFREVAVMLGDFFAFPKSFNAFEKLIKDSVEYLRTDNRNDSCGFEALAFAIRSKWDTDLPLNRRIIVLWSPNKFSPVGSKEKGVCYPKGMAKDFEELTKWWQMGSRGKRLLLFASDKSWEEVAEKWENTLLLSYNKGYGKLKDNEKESVLRDLIRA